MSALIAAAKKEGTLTLVGVPPTWANYGLIEKTFSRRYGIKVRSVGPGMTSEQEIGQIKRAGTSAAAADVLDIESQVAIANAGLFAPYQVSTWAAVPASQKAQNGAWLDDYGGFMSVGYDPTRFGTVTSLSQLLGPGFRNSVALDGDPTQASAAMYGVMMASLARGGTASEIGPGVAFFGKLAKAGNFVAVPATTGLTIKSGSTPVVVNWDYLNTPAVVGRSAADWKVFVPDHAAIGAFFAQAINKNAPHPAAARLWEEFLYSQASDGGQNLWLEGGVRPVEQAAMAADGTIDKRAAAGLPQVPGPAIFLTPGEAATAAAYLATHWAKAIR